MFTNKLKDASMKNNFIRKHLNYNKYLIMSISNQLSDKKSLERNN
jgi:hypothetical protein